MKKVIACAIILFLTTSSFSQQTAPGQPLSREDYLQKSKDQKTGAWVLLAGGVGLMGGGLLLGNREESSFDDAGMGVILGGLGFLSAIASIPVFTASSRNKRKAMAFSTHLEMPHNPVQGSLAGAFSFSPTMSVKVAF